MAPPAAHTAPSALAPSNARRSPTPTDTLPAAATPLGCADGDTADCDSLTSSISLRSSAVISYEFCRWCFSPPRSSSTGNNSTAPPPHFPALRPPSPLAPMRARPTPSPLVSDSHQPPLLPQSKFISFFNSLIKSAWFSNTSLSLRFSASNRFRSADFNGRLLRNDARTPTSNCRFHL